MSLLPHAQLTSSMVLTLLAPLLLLLLPLVLLLLLLLPLVLLLLRLQGLRLAGGRPGLLMSSQQRCQAACAPQRLVADCVAARPVSPHR